MTAKAILETLAAVGAQGTLLAIGALLLTRAGRLRPGWQAAVWLVVIAKFAIPWGPALPYSLADLLHLGGSPDAAGPLALAPGTVVAMHGPSALWRLALAVWLAGALVVVARAIVAHTRTVAAARRAPLAPASARLLLAELASAHRMRMPRLVVGTAGPHVVGVLRPIISIPDALIADRALLRAALLHELAHLRRFDGAVALVELAARAAFWCWPVVRLACRRLDAAREAACDAWALSASELPRPAYARLLVRMAQLRIAAAPSLAARTPHALDARVAAVLGPECRRRVGAVHALALLVWVGIALGGARSAHAARTGAVCRYSTQLASALFAAHPEADLDGDGVLSVDEACELQAELRRIANDSDQVSRLPEADASLLEEPLCCNCSAGAVNSAPEPVHVDACPVEGL